MPKLQAAEREFRRRFWWAISVPLVLMGILAALFAFQTRRLSQSLQAMSQSNTILIHDTRLRHAVATAESDAQQFLLSRDPARLRAYDEAQAGASQVLSELVRAQAADPSAGASASLSPEDSVQQAYQSWRAQMDRSVHSPSYDSRRASEDRFRWDTLLRAFDKVQQLQIAERAQSAAAAQSFVHHGSSYGIGLALILGILLSLFTRRQLKEISTRYRIAIEDANEKAQAAKDALLSRDDFFSIASHELKTPLTTLELRTHALQSLLDRSALPPPSRSSINLAMRSLRRQIHRLSELVDNILEATRITTGQMFLNRSDAPVAVESLIEQSVAALKDLLEQYNCRVDLNLEKVNATDWDKDRIVQALKALIGNSAKYAPNSTIEIRSHRADDSIRIEITDHGLGIASKDHPRIFRLFERAVSSRHYGGLGTGLFITREIIEGHQGTIRVLSSEGSGATVIIGLPLSVRQRKIAA